MIINDRYQHEMSLLMVLASINVFFLPYKRLCIDQVSNIAFTLFETGFQAASGVKCKDYEDE